MPSQLAPQHVGHLQEVLHIFAYLKAHANSELVFDSSENSFDKYEFPMQVWTYYIYNSGKIELREVLTPEINKHYGKVMAMQVYVYSNHDVYYVTHHSRSLLGVFLNNVTIYWIWKNQTS